MDSSSGWKNKKEERKREFQLNMDAFNLSNQIFKCWSQIINIKHV